MEKKRYTICALGERETRSIVNYDSVQNFLKAINKFNSNPKNIYYIGDINVDYKHRIIAYTKFTKLTVLSSLEELDKTTVNLNNEHELKRLYHAEHINGPLCITYRASKKIRTLNIMYKSEAKMLDKEYMSYRFSRLGTDINFVKRVLSSRIIKKSAVNSAEAFENLYDLRDKLKNSFRDTVSTEPMKAFFDSYTHVNGLFNYFNYRRLASLIIDYDRQTKELNMPIIEPTKTNKNEESKTIQIEEYSNEELKELYEELKMAMYEGDRDLVASYKRRLRMK